MGGLFIEDLYDVKAVLGLNDVRNFALFQAKSGLLELSDGLTLTNPAEVAAFVFRTWVFRIFLGEILEFGTALLGLLQDVFSLLADFRHFGVSLVIGQKQDVLDMNTVRNLVLLNIALVFDFELVIGDLGCLADLVGVD